MPRNSFKSLASLCALCVLCGAFLPACVSRSILITSDPPGAAVWLNDVPLGPTPVESEFKFYGTYDVRIRLDGYEPLVTSRDAVAPLYEYPGFDLVAAPFPIHKRIEWHFQLEPLPELTDRPAAEKALIERARAASKTVPPGLPPVPAADKFQRPAEPAPPEPRRSEPAGTPATTAPSPTAPSTTEPAPTTQP